MDSFGKMPDRKRPYVAPKVIRQPAEVEYIAFLKNEVEPSVGRSSKSEPGPKYLTVVDNDRKYVQVSKDFCKLVGYEEEELLGRRYDEVTASGTNDIDKVFSLFLKLGYMHGLWMLVSRQGTRILVRYDSWMRPDKLIESHMEVVGAGY